jgi:uncharacterized DUF497 family protein
MRFEWDEIKRLANIRKHEIDFVELEAVFAGETLTLVDARFDYGEDRFLTIGMLREKGVAISHTETDEVIRIISARKALRDEEITYFEEIKD